MNARRLLTLGVAAVLAAEILGKSTATAKPAAGACTDPAGCVILGPGARSGWDLAISDLAAPLGRETARAVELAVDARGGAVAGHRSSSSTSAMDATRPGDEDGRGGGLDKVLVSVIGTPSRPRVSLLEVAPILGGASITMISPSNTSPLLTDPATRDPFYFRTAYNDGLKAEALAAFLRAAGHETAAIVVEEGPGTKGWPTISPPASPPSAAR